MKLTPSETHRLLVFGAAELGAPSPGRGSAGEFVRQAMNRRYFLRWSRASSSQSPVLAGNDKRVRGE